MAINGSSVEQCLAIIRELSDTVDSARKTLINSDACVVSRSLMQDRLAQLENFLPEALLQAEGIIREDAALRAQTAQDCSEALTGAQNRAKQMIAEAQDQVSQAQAEVRKAGENAQRIVQEAQQRAQDDANRLIQQANQEAAAIRAKAEQDRDEMVSHENVYRVATVEAEELRESTRKELMQIRQSTFDYLDNVMGEVDRCLNSLSNDIRMERGELNNHR
ncbi:MAG: hypothetical protein E7316_09335 [Clostridiales bacterium]|nr:hypothetical protein [Clostridiales bacterium]